MVQYITFIKGVIDTPYIHFSSFCLLTLFVWKWRRRYWLGQEGSVSVSWKKKNTFISAMFQILFNRNQIREMIHIDHPASCWVYGIVIQRVQHKKEKAIRMTKVLSEYFCASPEGGVSSRREKRKCRRRCSTCLERARCDSIGCLLICSGSGKRPRI
jgi:hypothetical protein